MSGKYGLIIANTEYTDPGLAQLTAPGKDAEALWRVLNAPDLGAFDDVMLVLNQDSARVNERIEIFFSEKKPDDLLLLYFSGHGVRDENGMLYLAVKNTHRNRLRSTAVSSSFVKDVMDESRSKRQVLILDCCNSGAFAQGTKAATGVSIGTATAFGGYGHVVLTASDSTQYAWEGDMVIGGETQNSLFTHFLVKGLEGEADRNGDGQITVDELYDYAYEKVKLATPKQTPSKFSTKQQGEILLRQGISIKDIPPVPLPKDLLDAVESPYSYIREGAVKQLILLLNGRNLGLVRSAREALENIAENDDSRTISRIAFQAVEALRQADQAAQQEAEAEQRAAEEKRRADLAEKERKAEVERKVKEEADRLVAQQAEADRKAEEERKAQTKEEADRLVAQKAEADHLAAQQAEADRKAKEEADRLAAQKAEAERLAQKRAEEERLTQAKAEANRKAKEEADRIATQKTEEERLAQAKAEVERKAREEAERLAARKAEEERLAKQKAKEEADRISAQKAEGERLAQQRAEEERLAKAKAKETAVAAEVQAVPAIQKKPASKGLLYGGVAVVLLVIAGIAFSMMPKGDNKNTPIATSTTNAIVVAPVTAMKALPTDIPKPSNTPKPTSTPIPQPIVLDVSAAKQLNLSNNDSVKGFYQLSTEQHTEAELKNFSDSNQPIPLVMTISIPLQLGYSDCAKTQAILETNLKYITHSFKFKGNVIPASNYGTYDRTTTDDNGNPYYCRVTYIIIDKWVKGQYSVYQEEVQMQKINDGYQDTDPYTDQLEYVVTVP